MARKTKQSKKNSEGDDMFRISIHPFLFKLLADNGDEKAIAWLKKQKFQSRIEERLEIFKGVIENG